MTASKPTATTPRKRSARLARVVRLHIRLALSALLGAGVYAVLTLASWPERVTARFLIAWSIGAFCYLMTVLWLALRCDLTRLRQRSAEEDEGAALILLITVAAAVASLVAIFAELGATHRDQANWLS